MSVLCVKWQSHYAHQLCSLMYHMYAWYKFSRNANFNRSSFIDEALTVISVFVFEQLVWLAVSAELIGSKMANQ